MSNPEFARFIARLTRADFEIVLCEMNRLSDQIDARDERVKVLEAAISWALGEGDSDFGDHIPMGGPRFWWRNELRRRTALNPPASTGEQKDKAE